MKSKTLRHLNPIWKEKANFIIGINILGVEGHKEILEEQLWAKQLSDYRFEICCIPFFAYDLSLGDEVETSSNFIFDRVVQPSGNFTFRIWLKETKFADREEVLSFLNHNSYLIEWYSDNLLAVCALNQDHAQRVTDYLRELDEVGRLSYETGKS